MDRLEDELRRAFAREDAPEGFAGRVMARTSRRPAVARRWLAVAAMLVVATGAGAAWRQHQGLEAKREVMLALRLAAAPVERVQVEIRGISQ
jgi:hypothetical protein